MKPSISIDLPGWCTLRRDHNESSINEPLPASSGKATPPSENKHIFEGRDSCSENASNSFISATGGSFISATGGSDGGDSDDDDDDAIARLFSIGGVKRKRGRSNSDSQQQQQQQRRQRPNEGGEGAHHPGSARAKRAGTGRGSTAEFNLQAEAFLDWPCVRCTFINTFDQEACQGCGGANLKRDKLLRERRQEVERLGRLKSERECLDRSLKEEALKDVLEDSDSEDDSSSTAAAATSRTHPAGGDGDGGGVSANQPSSQGNSSSKQQQQQQQQQQASDPRGVREQACFIHVLPPDLLLQCSEYLGDTRTLCRVREVSLGWLGALDDREAGHRLWRPLFYRLRASGSIHKGTDATGQQHRKLKVYDLGPPTPTTTTTTTLGGTTDRGMSTSSSPGNRNAWSTGNPGVSVGFFSPPLAPSMGGGGVAAAAAATGNSNFRRSSACAVCGLIQREGYAGKDCEMCASSLVLMHHTASNSPATTPRVAYTRVNLSGSRSGAAATTTIGATPPPPPPSSPASLLGSASSSPSQRTPGAPVSTPGFRGSASSSSYRSVGDAGSASAGGAGGGGRVSGGPGLAGGEEGEGGGRDVDWHFLVKKVAQEKRIAAGWGSLRHGWVWLQRELQSMLRRRRGDEPFRASPSSTAAPKPVTPAAGGPDSATSTLSGDASSKRAGEGSCSFGVQCSATSNLSSDASSKTAGGGSCSFGQDPRVARLVRKLASKKWVLLYDSLKATFTLQAEGIAREVVLEATAAAADAISSGTACGAAGAVGKRASGAAGLERPRRCLAAWEAYKDWCEEVDVYCEPLNEQISAERYRTAGAGCGRGDNTPFIRDTALLSFRHSFALNICSFLRGAIAKGMSALEAADSTISSDSRPQAIRGETSNHAARNRHPRGVTAEFSVGGKASLGGRGVGDAEGLFTDLELMEDSRAIEFSVRSFARPGAAGVGSTGVGRAGAGGGGGESGGSCGGGGRGRARAGGGKVMVSRWSGSRRTGHYYDWFLSKLEGKEAGIIRGDVDARGKSVVRKPAGGGGGAGDVGGLRAATLEELLDLVRDMVEELDVPDDFLSKDRHTQGVMRRLLFLPVKRWQAAASEANAADDHQHLLMAGLSPAPGNEGFHRLRGGAAGRRKGTPPTSSLGKDAGKSWEQLSVLFG
ncbi:unnamed protein product [Laminaria digitata]